MKLLKVTTLYTSYIAKFYRKNPGLESRSYGEQKSKLDFDAFGWADFWANALPSVGYSVFEVSANVEALQKAWASENDVEFGLDWLHEIVAAQINSFRPDVLFMEDYTHFSASWIREIRASNPSIKSVIGWCGAPFDDASVFSAYDVVLSCIPELVGIFRKLGHRSEHLHHAFDPRVLLRIPADRNPSIDLSFVGQITRGRLQHERRLRLLEELANEFPVQIYSALGDITLRQEVKTLARKAGFRAIEFARTLGMPDRFIRKFPLIGRGVDWKVKPESGKIPSLMNFVKPSVFGLDMFATLRDSELTLNNHIDVSENSASNMRLFEATGAGACLVTDWKPNLSELFDSENEVVTYRTAEECAEKIRWLLRNKQRANAIAEAGQKRTLRDHTFLKRAPELDRFIRKTLA
jgi:spore maturation protein CgeB